MPSAAEDQNPHLQGVEYLTPSTKAYNQGGPCNLDSVLIFHLSHRKKKLMQQKK